MLIGLFLNISSLTGQDFIHQAYDWSEQIKPYVLPDSLSEEDAVFTMYRSFIEFNHQVDSENQQLKVDHYKLYLNSDEAIERNNKLYTAQSGSFGLYNSMKVRVIQPGGSVRTLDEKNIQSGVDEDSGTEYNYYAIEDLKIGSEIEVIIKTQRTPQFYGRLFYIQKSYPVFDYAFEYISPKHLEFAFKTYNTDQVFVSEENGDYVFHKLEIDYIEKYKQEELSNEGSNKAYLVFKLERNNAQGGRDINGFGHFSQVIGKRALNKNLDPAEIQLFDESYEVIGIEANDSDELKVLKIENFVKENVAYIENIREESLETVSSIFQQNAFNVFGAIIVYNQYLQRAGLSLEVVVTCDKTVMNFDEDFENFMFLDKILFYLPELESCLDPANAYSRLQFFDTNYQGHPGLFVKSRTIGTSTTAIGKVKDIPSSSGKESVHRSIIDVNILEDFEDIEIKVNMEKTGHTAKIVQPFFDEVPEDNKESFYQFAIFTYADQMKMETVKFENTEKMDFPLNPLKSYCEIENEDFWQNAGNNHILSAGALIGPQSQMYNSDESARRTPINSNYARRFQYEISFNIPSDYEVSNLEDFNLDVDGSNGDYVFYFKSYYEREGDQVKIIVDELYDHDYYPAQQFPAYQKVINAAADFSKKKVVFKLK